MECGEENLTGFAEPVRVWVTEQIENEEVSFCVLFDPDRYSTLSGRITKPDRVRLQEVLSELG